MKIEMRIVEMSVLEAQDALTWREYLRALDNALAWHLAIGVVGGMVLA